MYAAAVAGGGGRPIPFSSTLNPAGRLVHKAPVAGGGGRPNLQRALSILAIYRVPYLLSLSCPVQAGLCTQLQRLEVVGSKDVDDVALIKLTSACPCLRQVVLKVCGL